jgi:glucosamine--fructose-6-phosphate aminotransferase (isomerizing)
MSRFRDEVGEQPLLALRMLAESRGVVASIASRVRASNARGFVVAARGSSDHAALYAKYLFGVRNHMMVTLAAPSLFTSYGKPPDLEGQCVIGISQSGSSPDIVAVIEEAVRQGLVTIAVTNDPESPLAGAAELHLRLGAGPELSVPASKTYLASLLALALLSQAMDPDPSFEAALGQVPPALAAALEQDHELDRLVPALLGPRAIVLGRGFNFSTAEEVALKLTEMSHVLARAWSVADFEHGPIAVVEPGFPVVLVDGRGQVSADMESIGRRLADQGCRVVRLLDGAGDHGPADATVSLDSGLPEELTPLTLAVLGQLLAHRVALARGIDPDRPRALNEVTRTW